MEKVFLVIEESSFDGDNEVDVKAYKELSAAQNYIKERIKEIKDEDFGYDNELEEDYYYNGYVEGFFNNDHTTIYIEVKDVL